MATETVHAAHPAAAPGERGGALPVMHAEECGVQQAWLRGGHSRGEVRGLRVATGWGLMELPLGPADHAGAAFPELPPGAVPLHQGPGDAEEPVPDHGQWLCEWGGACAGLTTPDRAAPGAGTETSQRGGSPRTGRGEACSAVCPDLTCPDPSSQMGKLRLRGRARMCWASGSSSAVGVTPAPRLLPDPCPLPSLGRGLSASSPRS